MQRALRPLVLSAHVHEHSKMGEAMEKFNAYVEANAERFIEELKEFCRQPSIAAQGIGLEEMGQLVRARLDWGQGSPRRNEGRFWPREPAAPGT